MQTVKMLEPKGKLCTPVIDWDGGILLGETSCCTAFGHKVRESGCRSCGLDANLPLEYKEAV